MSKESFAPPASETEDLDDGQVVTEIFESGTDEQMERLRQRIAERAGKLLTKEDMQRYRVFARQRRRLIDQAAREAHTREKERPDQTDLEQRLGIYAEWLEPQVRNAVLVLCRKGYRSWESGFTEFDGQGIGFEDPVPELSTTVMSGTLREIFRAAGAELLITETSVGFRLAQPVDDETVTALWNQLADALPTLASKNTPG